MLTNTFISSRRRRWWNELPVADHVDRAASRGDDLEVGISLVAALQRLPLRPRLMVVLRYYADLSVDEVAGALGCAPGTVKSSTSKAIAQLRADPSVNALMEEAR